MMSRNLKLSQEKTMHQLNSKQVSNFHHQKDKKLICIINKPENELPLSWNEIDSLEMDKTKTNTNPSEDITAAI